MPKTYPKAIVRVVDDAWDALEAVVQCGDVPESVRNAAQHGQIALGHAADEEGLHADVAV